MSGASGGTGWKPGWSGIVSAAGTVRWHDDGPFRPGGGAHQSGLHGRRNGVRAELALWERVVRQVDLGHQVNAQTGIVPAMNQLNFEHSLGLEDMVDLVVDNPFVAPGYSEQGGRIDGGSAGARSIA